MSNTPADSDSSRARVRIHVFAAISLTALAVALRSIGIQTRAQWFDEVFCWRMIQFSWPEMFARVAQDNHSPLYFSLLKLWSVAFGLSTVALRSFSLFCGVVTLGTTYGLARELRLSRAGEGTSGRALRGLELVVLALVALSPSQILWSSQVRMYTFAGALAAASSWALLYALRRASLRSWVLYGILAALMFYAQYSTLFIFFAQLVFATIVLVRRAGSLSTAPRALIGPAVGVVAFALCFAPWVRTFMRQRAQVSTQWWVEPLTPAGIGHAWTSLTESGIDAIMLVAVSVATLASVASAWRARGLATFPFVATVLPFIALTVLSLRGTNMLLDRYLLPGALFFNVSLAVLVCTLESRAAKIIAGTLLAMRCAASLVPIHAVLTCSGPVPSVYEHLRVDRLPDEPVFMNPMHYFSLKALGDLPNAYLYWYDGRLPHYLGTALLTEQDHVVGSEALDRFQGRAFFVQADPPASWKKLEQRGFATCRPGVQLTVTTARRDP